MSFATESKANGKGREGSERMRKEEVQTAKTSKLKWNEKNDFT